MDTPIGTLWLAADEHGLTSVAFHEPHEAPAPSKLLEEASEQLSAYFAGELETFSLPLAPRGTDFQRSVWDEVARIPYGETASYAAIAGRLGRPRACRAVGAANGRNPLAILIPCHRVLGSAGGLTGYGGGLSRKRALLDFESRAG
jgi:methylated-DNA-[protein]-cysteine S-methyltransferase